MVYRRRPRVANVQRGAFCCASRAIFLDFCAAMLNFLDFYELKMKFLF